MPFDTKDAIFTIYQTHKAVGFSAIDGSNELRSLFPYDDQMEEVDVAWLMWISRTKTEIVADKLLGYGKSKEDFIRKYVYEIDARIGGTWFKFYQE